MNSVLELVPAEVSRVGEPLEVDDENGRELPDGDLFRGLSMLLALRAIPGEGTSHQKKLSFKFKV